MKGPKVMFTQQIIQDVKKRSVPAPGAYATNELFGKRSRPLNPKEGSSEKFCGFIDAASWRGHQTPFAQWDKNGAINYRQKDVNPRIAKMWKQPDNSKDKRIDRIQKDKTKPAQGDYLT